MTKYCPECNPQGKAFSAREGYRVGFFISAGGHDPDSCRSCPGDGYQPVEVVEQEKHIVTGVVAEAGTFEAGIFGPPDQLEAAAVYHLTEALQPYPLYRDQQADQNRLDELVHAGCAQAAKMPCGSPSVAICVTSLLTSLQSMHLAPADRALALAILEHFTVTTADVCHDRGWDNPLLGGGGKAAATPATPAGLKDSEKAAGIVQYLWGRLSSNQQAGVYAAGVDPVLIAQIRAAPATAPAHRDEAILGLACMLHHLVLTADDSLLATALLRCWPATATRVCKTAGVPNPLSPKPAQANLTAFSAPAVPQPSTAGKTAQGGSPQGASQAAAAPVTAFNTAVVPLPQPAAQQSKLCPQAVHRAFHPLQPNEKQALTQNHPWLASLQQQPSSKSTHDCFDSIVLALSLAGSNGGVWALSLADIDLAAALLGHWPGNTWNALKRVGVADVLDPAHLQRCRAAASQAAAAPVTAFNTAVVPSPQPAAQKLVAASQPFTQADVDILLDIHVKWLFDPSAAGALKANFSGCTMKGIEFKGANLDGVDFSGAELTGCSFDHVSLKGACFKDANLIRTSIAHCQLFRASFEGAGVGDCSLLSSWLVELDGMNSAWSDTCFYDCSFERAGFKDANLQRCRFGGAAVFTRTSFIKANLAQSYFSKGVTLDGATITGALLDDCFFGEKDALMNASGVTAKQRSTAFYGS